MNKPEAAAELFLMVFRALPKAGRAALINQLLSDPEFLEGLMDVDVIAPIEHEPSRLFDELAEERRQVSDN